MSLPQLSRESHEEKKEAAPEGSSLPVRMLHGKRLPVTEPCSQGTLGTGQAQVQASKGRGEASGGGAGQGRGECIYPGARGGPGAGTGLIWGGAGDRPVRGRGLGVRGAIREMAHQGGFGSGAVRIGLLEKKGACGDKTRKKQVW